MGIAASCVPLIVISSSAKVLSCDGKLEMYTRPIKAAELMLDNPGRFVCDSVDLKVGHRIHGLYADQQLLRRHFYFLLPMELLYSVLTDEEMLALNRNASRHSTNFSKIVLGGLCVSPFHHNTEKGLIVDYTPAEEEAVERYMSKQKSYSWRPALDTILETPCM